MQFEDGEVAKRDVAIEAGFSSSASSELAPMLVMMKGNKQPDSLDGCFSAGGAPLRASAIEKNDALVVMVKDPVTRPQAAELQFDADTVGSASPAADAEMCMLAADTMEALGVPRGSYVVRLNNRKVLDGVMETIGLGGEQNVGRRLTVLRAIDKLDRLGVAGQRRSGAASDERRLAGLRHE